MPRNDAACINPQYRYNPTCERAFLQSIPDTFNFLTPLIPPKSLLYLSQPFMLKPMQSLQEHVCCPYMVFIFFHESSFRKERPPPIIKNKQRPYGQY
ncbi:MAG: hypothetical protein KAR47_08290, partial [Planctomycetes bacterium]|nr:hypothetical protein [Planctomycetota bacterium]